ncbi:hypothetical protein [Nostoc sp.]|uniref:hypothetical protein n=1 Tax=Nostoc sp. TaxID=1180 RepID=UPI002FFB6D7A
MITAAIRASISDEQAKRYGERLAQGQYLIVVEGTANELHQAETVLSTQGIQDWSIFDTL